MNAQLQLGLNRPTVYLLYRMRLVEVTTKGILHCVNSCVSN